MTRHPSDTALGPQDVRDAAGRIAGLVRRTPVIRCEALDELAGAELWLKAENLQRIGAFKARGAFNNLAQLSDEQRSKGVITYSSGNHAQAVALAAKHYGVSARIAMPVDAPAIKREVVESLGAEVVSVGTTSLERKKAAFDMHAESGATIVEPFDHPWTIAGQGTATLELLEDVAERTGGGGLDALCIPVGGGGLVAGACVATAGTEIEIHTAEPVGCDALAQSLAAGELVPVEPGPTLADGLKPTRIGELNFAIARERVTKAHTVTDDEIGSALVKLLFCAKLLVEPSGAAALAVALRGAVSGRGRVGVLLSGGNIAPSTLRSLIETY